MGHNRFTTVGDERIIGNNHPFMTKRFAFAHNGTFSNYTEVKNAQELKDNGIETDSYVMLQLIDKYVKNKFSITTAIANACEDIDGVLACWLWDRKNKHIYLFRRSTYWSSSPLSIVWFRNMLLFCSDLNYIKEAILKVYGNSEIYHYNLDIREAIRIDLKTQKIKTFDLPITKAYPTNYYAEDFYNKDDICETDIKEHLHETLSLICSYGIQQIASKKGSQLFEITDGDTAHMLKRRGWCVTLNKNKDNFMNVKNKNLTKLYEQLFDFFGYDDDMLDNYGNSINDTHLTCIEPPEDEEEIIIPRKFLRD